MSKFKVGDDVFLSNETYERGSVGDKATIVHDYGDKMYRLLLKSGEDKGSTCVKFEREFNLINQDYESSNRYKLKQAIKETGISSRKLSHFAVGNESFFYNQTGRARFNEFGDISQARLESMRELLIKAKDNLNAKIEQDAFDEREKLDLAAKTVDENNVPVVDEIYTNTKGEEISLPDTKPQDMSNWSEIGNSDQEDYSRYVEQLQSQAIEKRDYRLRNFMIAFLILVIILAVCFFNH